MLVFVIFTINSITDRIFAYRASEVREYPFINAIRMENMDLIKINYCYSKGEF